MILLIVFTLGLTYIGFSFRKLSQVKTAQLRLDQIKFINDPKVDIALTEILWVWEWSDFDDYWQKYSPRANPDANNTRRIARN